MPNAVRRASRCGGGQTVEEIEHRRAQLVQSGEGQLHLRLDAGGAHDPTARRARRHVVQQRGLADAGFAMDDERSALTGSKGLDELFEHAAFGAASDQFHREPPFVAGPPALHGIDGIPAGAPKHAFPIA